jgi:hypothetical protein
MEAAGMGRDNSFTPFLISYGGGTLSSLCMLTTVGPVVALDEECEAVVGMRIGKGTLELGDECHFVHHK